MAWLASGSPVISDGIFPSKGKVLLHTYIIIQRETLLMSQWRQREGVSFIGPFRAFFLTSVRFLQCSRTFFKQLPIADMYIHAAGCELPKII